MTNAEADLPVMEFASSGHVVFERVYFNDTQKQTVTTYPRHVFSVEASQFVLHHSVVREDEGIIETRHCAVVEVVQGRLVEALWNAGNVFYGRERSRLLRTLQEYDRFSCNTAQWGGRARYEPKPNCPPGVRLSAFYIKPRFNLKMTTWDNHGRALFYYLWQARYWQMDDVDQPYEDHLY